MLVWAPLLEHGEESGAWERSGMEKIKKRRPKILPKEFLSFPDINSPAIVLFSTYRKFGGQNGQQDEVNPYLKAVLHCPPFDIEMFVSSSSAIKTVGG